MRDLVSDCEICHSRPLSRIQTDNHIPGVCIPVDVGFQNKPNCQCMSVEFGKFIEGQWDSLHEFWSHCGLHRPSESDSHDEIFPAVAVMCGPFTRSKSFVKQGCLGPTRCSGIKCKSRGNRNTELSTVVPSNGARKISVVHRVGTIMAKPVLLTVDDDSDVLRAIERDLRSKYGADYRVIGSDSPQEALNVLKQLKVRNDSVALLLADQRMPQMDGVTFLREGIEIFPDAKRALLTAYADTNAAISAINEANIHYFFMKPWDPPTEHLYPQLDDLLDDWRAAYRPTFEGIRVLGSRWSPKSYELRNFLARNRVPY